MRRSYTDSDLIEAVQCCTSIRQVLSRLNLAAAGGNYTVVKAHIRRLEIPTAHFTGQGWKRGDNRPIVPAKPLEEILLMGVSVQSFKLKRRLLKENLKFARCESCGLEEWQGKPIPLELDHINGDPRDNRIENLRLVCPNCHALTATYRGKNKAKRRDETAPS